MSTTTMATTTYKTIDSDSLQTIIASVLDRKNVLYRTKKIGTDNRHYIQLILDSLSTRVNGDQVTPILYLRNSNDGTSALTFSIGLLRQVCSNGLMLPSYIYTDRVVHRVGPKVEKYLETFGSKVETAISFIASGEWIVQIEAETSAPILTIDLPSILASMGLSTRLAEAVEVAWNTKRTEDTDTTWGLYNVVNEVMRKRGRSERAQLDRNIGLLAAVVAARAPTQASTGGAPCLH